MERTSIHDFQIHHNKHDCVRHTGESGVHNDPIESIERYSDDDEGHEASAPHSSGPDEALFDNVSRHSSPATSQHSDEDISLLPSEPHDASLLADHRVSSPFTPLKTRSPFRNPSSVRAMQMETTPPPYLISPSSQQRYKFTGSSRNGTPQSTRSYHSAMRSPSKLSPMKKVKKEYPLVLLHVTLLPLNIPYSAEVMESVLPTYVLENWKLLREKAASTVLERGILIPHPKEDYDLLEERLLESLELTLPRILKCGHFHLEPETEEEITAAAEADEEYNGDDDADICDDCGRRIRDGRLGSGTGNRRWDLRIYAANGLMRAGAWSAAWREMERVDVEIRPWISEEMRRELELRREEQEGLAPEDGPASDVEVERGEEKAGEMDDARLREIYGEHAEALVDGLSDARSTWNEPGSTARRPRARQTPHQDVPLWDLLKNYVYLAAQDRRNIAILILSLLVLLLSLGTSGRPQPLPPPQQAIPTSMACAMDLGVDATSKTTSLIPSAAEPSLAMDVFASTKSGAAVVREVLGMELGGEMEAEMG
ncbi:hypothetical protein MMC08_004482 [Hypocenomyce scalaris]|nr:hypothetical protein [Hypocenomyce scalaris]